MLLIISRSRKQANETAEMFYMMGILACGFTHKEVKKEASPAYRAVIVLNPCDIPGGEELFPELKRYFHGAPIVALGDAGKMQQHFDIKLSSDTYAPAVLRKITAYICEQELPMVGDYRLAAVNASCDNIAVTFFGAYLGFTKTEAMIVRYLIRSYPIPVTTEQILSHAFRQSRRPDSPGVRTHISKINKKFSLLGKHNLIINRPGEGYVFYTHEYALTHSL